MKQRTAQHPNTFRKSYPCSYFEDGRISTTEYIVPDLQHARHFHEFLARGYRRLGTIFYRNACYACGACIPLRLEAERFTFSKSQKRTFHRNGDITIEFKKASFLSLEKIILYKNYVNSRHPDDRGEEEIDHETVLSMIHFGYEDTIEMDYTCNGKLIGVGIVDRASDALSSHYFYYDTDYLERRLGIFSMLKEIELARGMHKRYYYPGFCIEENPKMAYKKFLRPNQIYMNGRWKNFSG